MAMASQMGNMFGGVNPQNNQQHNQQNSAPAAATPPPPPPQVTYFVAVDGKAQGPYDMATIKGMVESGAILRDTLVWSEGMAEWEKASDKIAHLFSSQPPAL